MVYNKEDWISQRAYAIWEAEGRPCGREAENWQQAAAEFEQLQMTKASIDGTDLIAMLRATGRLMRASENDQARIIQERATIAKR
ncbi:DUF2934 domain-containing protein [Rhizobium mongolense]|uniref:DUF2934 domain-containing protein n=1 Tax=Rhizobium TaxID=379 RepID=UPI001EF8B304|nr:MULTISPECIES: DUF2934 domain-containing protein [Rhizobium]ULJ76036.1 DUF2934 domain-containing protein [Rhizobium gallicum]WFU90784.1 DUF2934 domain-containing protein [Rhizobium sp. CC1099]